MTTRPDPAGGWRKSSYSGSGNNCVEVHTSHDNGVAVRDSNNPHGPVLTFTASQWRVFTHALKAASSGQPRPR
jgi:hypothetical protein